MIYTLCIKFQRHHFTVQNYFSTVFKDSPTFLKKALDICLLPTVYPLKRDTKNLLFFNKPKGKKKLTSPIFDNELSSLPKTIKIGVKYCVFPTK